MRETEENLLGIPDAGRVQILLSTVERLEKQKQHYLTENIVLGKKLADVEKIASEYGQRIKEQVDIKQRAKALLLEADVYEGQEYYNEDELEKYRELVARALEILSTI